MSVKRITSKKPYLLTQDDDGHWYLLPLDTLGEFYDWLADEAAYYDLADQPLDFNDFRINGPHTLKIYSWADNV